jgi:hypothetical protein
MADNLLVEEHNRAHAKRIAREDAVKRAASPAAAAALAEQHAREDTAEAANVEAYKRAAMAEHKRHYGPAVKVPAKAATVAAKSAAPAPASKPALPVGAIAARARDYIDEQAKLGKHVTAAEAVAYITNTL